MIPAVNIVGHTKTIIVHKFHVARYCFRAGLYRQGITHDMSKFSPIEFAESARYFQGTDSPINAAKKDNGYSIAWQHHKGRNPHHYEYWVDDLDHGGKPLQMPFEYALELVCDYLGAGRAYMGSDFSYELEYAWWQAKKSEPMAMHLQTMRFVDQMLSHLADTRDETILRKNRAKEIYDRC